MTRFFVISRRQLFLYGTLAVLLVALAIYLKQNHIIPTSGPAGGDRVFHMVTGEFKSTLPDGTTIESYRWDPGTLVVNKGDRVKLVIYGVNGESHPFIIEGLHVKGEVKKGQETVVTFDAAKEGIYRIICLTHPDRAHNGPMLGYIVID